MSSEKMYHIPASSEQELETREIYKSREDEGEKRTIYRRAIAGVAGLALVATAGVATALAMGGSNEVKAKDRPTASAPAVPGPLETGVSTPNQETESGPGNVSISMDIDGNKTPETYTNTEDLAKALELTTPDANAAGKLLVEHLDAIAQWATSEEARKQNANYTSKDGSETGAAAVATDIVLPAVEEAFTNMDNTQPDMDAMTDEWKTSFKSFISDIMTSSSLADSEYGNGTPYSIKLTPVSAKFDTTMVGDEGTKGTIKLYIKDNYKETGLTAVDLGTEKNHAFEWSMNFKKVDGRLVINGIDRNFQTT